MWLSPLRFRWSARADRRRIRGIAQKFLLAVQDAGKIYRHIEAAKGKGNFIPEVSMDETDTPQKPVDMLFILAALADEGVPLQNRRAEIQRAIQQGRRLCG